MFHAKAFFLPRSLKGEDNVIGRVRFSIPQSRIIDWVCLNLCRGMRYGYSPSRVLHFVREAKELGVRSSNTRSFCADLALFTALV